MRKLTWLLAALLVSTSVGRLWALPADLSVAAYKHALEDCEKQATATASEEFAEETKNVELLSKPFKLKDTVTLNSTISGQLTGVLYSISAGADPLVQVGDRRVNMSDLANLDQKRLLLGQMPDDKQKKELAKVQQDLETKKTNRIQFLTKRKLETKGYTESFFLATVIMGDAYRVLGDLGDRRVQVTLATGTLDEDPTSAYYFITIINPMAMATDVVVLWNGKPLATNQPPATAVPELKDQTWKRLVIPLARENFGADAPTSIVNSLRLDLYKVKAGRWELEPVRLANKSKDQRMLAEFVCTLDKTRVRGFEPAMAAEFTAAATDALKAMSVTKENLDTALRAVKANLKELEEKKRKQKEEEERKRRDAETMAKLLTTIKKQEVDWIDRGGKIAASDEINQTLVLNATPEFGPLNAPQRLDDNDVVKFGPWEAAEAPLARDEAIDTKISGYHYRYLHCNSPGDDPAPVFYLQYYLWCQNKSDTEQVVTPEVSVVFDNGDALKTNFTYTVPASFSGYLVAAKVITIEQAIAGVKTLAATMGKKAAVAPGDAGKDDEKGDGAKPDAEKPDAKADTEKTDAKADAKVGTKADVKADAKTEAPKDEATKPAAVTNKTAKGDAARKPTNKAAKDAPEPAS